MYGRLPRGSDESFKRLAGWARVPLAPGETRTVAVPVDVRVLQTFDEVRGGWNLAPGQYELLVGPSSDNTPLHAQLRIQ